MTALVLVADTSLSGVRVARELTILIGMRREPHAVVSEYGAEQSSLAILRWSQERRVEWHYIASGMPMQNGFVESFNGVSETNASTRRWFHRYCMPASRSTLGGTMTAT